MEFHPIVEVSDMPNAPLQARNEISIPAEQIDGWAEIYREAKSAGLMQVPLPVFLSNPIRHIAEAALSDSDKDDFLPLLPRQAEVATRLQEQWDREDALRASHLTIVSSR